MKQRTPRRPTSNTHFTSRPDDGAMKRRHLLLGAGLAAWLPAARASDDQAWTDTARGRGLPLRLRWPGGSAPCALIVHSHGLGGNREGGDRWGEAWQAAGFAVLHLQHPGSDTETLRAGGVGALRAAASAKQLRARVADVQFVIDEVLRRAARGDAPWTRVQGDAIGVSGHSFGAHTVQALAGQRFPVAAEGAADARIRAFIAFSPSLGASGLTAQEQFSRVTRPFLAVTGTNDGDPLGGAKTGADRARVYDSLPAGRRALLWIEGADHATFGGNTRTRRRAARLMRRHPDAERDEGLHQERIARATTDWWRAMLLGDATALRSLREQVRMD